MTEGNAAVPLTPSVHIELDWEGERRFRGGRPGEPKGVIDGAREVAPSPVDHLVLALMACSGIDVLHVLDKRRTPARSMHVGAVFARVDGFPKRLKVVELIYRVDTDSDIPHIQRAVDLSLEKYCSVAGSLAPDIEITTRVERVSGEGEAELEPDGSGADQGTGEQARTT